MKFSALPCSDKDKSTTRGPWHPTLLVLIDRHGQVQLGCAVHVFACLRGSCHGLSEAPPALQAWQHGAEPGMASPVFADGGEPRGILVISLLATDAPILSERMAQEHQMCLLVCHPIASLLRQPLLILLALALFPPRHSHPNDFLLHLPWFV